MEHRAYSPNDVFVGHAGSSSMGTMCGIGSSSDLDRAFIATMEHRA
jgi:hypothetical protein